MSEKILQVGNGFIGKNIAEVLNVNYDLTSVGSKECNLLEYKECDKVFQDVKPTTVIYSAGKSGGIWANKTHAFEFWHNNMIMVANFFKLCKENKVRKIIYLMPGCSYPAHLAILKEESLFEGFCDIIPSVSALPKREGITACFAINKQYDVQTSILIPSNGYGKYDHFADPLNAHVIPSLIVKFHTAKKFNETVSIWGDGSAVRDFVFASDIAEVIPHFIENDGYFPSDNPCLQNVVNISTGKGTSIFELTQAIKEITGFTGKVVYDSTKPSGPASKIFDNERMRFLGLKCKTDLHAGLEKTYKWFLENHE